MTTDWNAVKGFGLDPNGEWVIEAKFADGKHRTIARFHSGFEPHLGFDAEQEAKRTCIAVNVGRTRPAIDVAGHQWTRCESCGAQWEIVK